MFRAFGNGVVFRNPEGQSLTRKSLTPTENSTLDSIPEGMGFQLKRGLIASGPAGSVVLGSSEGLECGLMANEEMRFWQIQMIADFPRTVFKLGERVKEGDNPALKEATIVYEIQGLDPFKYLYCNSQKSDHVPTVGEFQAATADYLQMNSNLKVNCSRGSFLRIVPGAYAESEEVCTTDSQ